MAALQCDICGGKLIGRPGGIFECDSCGMEYSTEWAKAKIQEIRGTVKVEGTVEVAGTVKVDGPVKVEGGISAQSLCERGFFELENRKAQLAKDAFSRALDIDITWGDVYMGLIMCDYNAVRNREEFHKRLLQHEFDEHRLFSKFLSDTGSSLHQEMVREFKAQQVREETVIAENRRRGAEQNEYYGRLRKKYSPIRGRITQNGEYILDHSGTLHSQSALCGSDFEAQTPWKDMLWIRDMDMRKTYKSMLIGAYADGTVIAENKDQRVEVFSPDDQVVEAIGVGTEDTQGFVGRLKNGSLVTATCGFHTDLLRDELIQQKQRWDGKTVEALCEFTKDYVLCPVVPSDGEVGDIAWTETGPITTSPHWGYCFRMVAHLRTDGTAYLRQSWHNSLDVQVAQWRDLIQVVPGKTAAAGLRADGKVLYAYRYVASAWHGDVQKMEFIKETAESWSNIVFIRMIDDDVIGIRRDGTLVSTDSRYAVRKAMMEDIRLFENIDTLESDLEGVRAAAFSRWEQGYSPWSIEDEKVEAEEEDLYAELQEELQQQIEAIHREMEGLKGIFAMKRRRELEEKMGMLLLKLDSFSVGNEE